MSNPKVPCDRVRWSAHWQLFVICRRELGHEGPHRDYYGYQAVEWIPRDMINGLFVTPAQDSQ